MIYSNNEPGEVVTFKIYDASEDKYHNVSEHMTFTVDEHTGNALDPVFLQTSPEIPETFSLSQNYPNPFNPMTAIDYELPEEGLVKLTIYNVLGQETAVLVNDIVFAGYHTAVFNSGDLSSGIYFYQLEVNGSILATQKMMLLK